MRIRYGVRILWLSVVMVLLFAGLFGRLFQIQIAHGSEYAHMAYSQRTLFLPVDSRRGMILDRNGIPLTDPQPAWAVGVFPPLIKEPADTAARLSGLLHTPAQQLLQALKASPGAFWLAKGLTEQAARQVAAANLPGVAVGITGARYGPGALAHHLVGYVNAEGGKLGLEQAFDEALTGDRAPRLVMTMTARQSPYAGSGVQTVMPLLGKEPYRLETTIDSQIQRVVEEVLDRQGSGIKAAVVVLDPSDGEVLAMASRPDFEYGSIATTGTSLLNRALAQYPPGSVFKPVIAAAALEKGLVKLDEEFYCSGEYDLGPNRFHDVDGTKHGQLTLREAIAKSCNITFLKIGNELLGIDAMRTAALHFGFGQRAGLLGPDHTLAEEQAGNVPRGMADGALQLAFGQGGLLVTPLQVARFYASIANGGILPAIKLVKVVRSPTGEVIERPAVGRSERVMSTATAKTLQQGLAAVTDPQGVGTGRGAWIPKAGSAGKSGTAEGSDGAGRIINHAWFAGYFPLQSPRYVTVVLVDGGGLGGAVAGPIFRQIGEGILGLQ
ncbi:MAG: peptidoglycan D,D-transpeptidase FtsI family protein [Mycobacterium leprae]